MEGMNCKYCGCDWCDGQGEDYVPDICEWFRPMTNADRIRAMTDEELAKWIEMITQILTTPGGVLKKPLIEWLKEEVKDGST
jgi:hypothetical protein